MKTHEEIRSEMVRLRTTKKQNTHIKGWLMALEWVLHDGEEPDV